MTVPYYMSNDKSYILCRYDVNKTAYAITDCSHASGDVKIPAEIDCIEVTSIKKDCFKNNKQIDSVDFSSNPEIKIIEEDFFTNSSIKCLILSPQITELQEGWCNNTPQLKKLEIPPENPYFKYLDSEKMIVVYRKSTSNKIFNELIFVSPDATEITIPRFITKIGSGVFKNFKAFKSIDFNKGKTAN